MKKEEEIALQRQFANFVKESVTEFIEANSDYLGMLPERFSEEFKVIVQEARMNDLGAITYGNASNVAFVLEHGDYDFAPLKFKSWLDRVVGEKVTKALESL